MLETPANPVFADLTGTSSEVTMQLAVLAWVPQAHGPGQSTEPHSLFAAMLQAAPLLVLAEGMGCRECHQWVTLEGREGATQVMTHSFLTPWPLVSWSKVFICLGVCWAAVVTI